MSPWRTIRRGADRVARTVRYGWRASLDVSRSSTDVLYPEYDAYDLKPRRHAPIAALAVFAVAGVLGVYLALANGLGTLILGSFTSDPAPGQGPAARPTVSPSATGPRIGQPQPAPAPTVTVTSVIPGAHTTSTATITASPTHTRRHGKPGGTPTTPAPPVSTPPTDDPSSPDPGGSGPPTESPTPDPTGLPEGP